MCDLIGVCDLMCLQVCVKEKKRRAFVFRCVCVCLENGSLVC